MLLFNDLFSIKLNFKFAAGLIKKLNERHIEVGRRCSPYVVCNSAHRTLYSSNLFCWFFIDTGKKKKKKIIQKCLPLSLITWLGRPWGAFGGRSLRSGLRRHPDGSTRSQREGRGQKVRQQRQQGGEGRDHLGRPEDGGKRIRNSKILCFHVTTWNYHHILWKLHIYKINFNLFRDHFSC